MKVEMTGKAFEAFGRAVEYASQVCNKLAREEKPGESELFYLCKSVGEIEFRSIGIDREPPKQASIGSDTELVEMSPVVPGNIKAALRLIDIFVRNDALVIQHGSRVSTIKRATSDAERVAFEEALQAVRVYSSICLVIRTKEAHAATRKG